MCGPMAEVCRHGGGGGGGTWWCDPGYVPVACVDPCVEVWLQLFKGVMVVASLVSLVEEVFSQFGGEVAGVGQRANCA